MRREMPFICCAFTLGGGASLQTNAAPTLSQVAALFCPSNPSLNNDVLKHPPSSLPALLPPSLCLTYTHKPLVGPFPLWAGVSEATEINSAPHDSTKLTRIKKKEKRGSVALCDFLSHAASQESRVFVSSGLNAGVQKKFRTFGPWADEKASEYCAPINQNVSLSCTQHLGALRPGADTRSKGCRGNHRPPSPWWWIGAGGLHQIGPHDLCYRPADK